MELQEIDTILPQHSADYVESHSIKESVWTFDPHFESVTMASKFYKHIEIVNYKNDREIVQLDSFKVMCNGIVVYEW